MKGNKIFSLLAALMVFIGLLVPATVSADSGGWSRFQYDLNNSGVTGDAAPTGDVEVAWKQVVGHQNGAGINVCPLAAEGKVYVLDALGKMWAFNATSGTMIWQTQLSSTGMKFQLAVPAYLNGVLYVATNDDHVYAINGSSGTILWETNIRSQSYTQANTPVVVADGKVYVGSWVSSSSKAEYYYCLNASDGTAAFSGTTPTYSMPNTSSGGGYYWAGASITGRFMIFGSDNSNVSCLDKDTGALLSRVSLKSIESTVMVVRSSVSCDPARNRLFFTDEKGWCWAFDLDPETGALTYRWHTAIGYSTSTPAVYNGRVYVGSGNYGKAGSLWALDEDDGSVIWTFAPPNGGGIESSPAISTHGGSIHICLTANCENGAAYCVDGAGNQVWEYVTQEAGGTNGFVLQGMAIADGMAYFGNDGGCLYALKVNTPPWDVNGDSSIDVFDMVLVGNHFGETGTPGWIPEDVNSDGAIDVFDMVIIGNHFGDEH